MISKKFYILTSFFFSYLALAQVTFRAVSGRDRVQVGEAFELNFVLTLKEQVNVGAISYPSFSGFKMIGRKKGRQLNIINGDRTIQDIETVILKPERKGKFRIGKASININDEVYETNDVIINVTDAPKTSVRNSGNQFVFLDVELSQDSVYLNEPVYATVKLYSKSYDALKRRSDLDISDLSKFQVTKTSTTNDYRDIKQEVVNNQLYISEVVGEYALTPQRTGELVIPPFAIRVAVPIDFFDEKIVELYSQEKEIKVKRLPKNAPKSFNGAVGEFLFNVEANRNNLEENKAFEVKMELQGTGNLSGIELPKLSLNEDLEVYDPKRRNAYKDVDNVQKGKITDAYVVVPQYGGTYKIPAVEFTYFNPNTAKYVTLRSQNIDLNIKGSLKPSLKDSVLNNIETKSEEREVSPLSTIEQGIESTKDSVKSIENALFSENQESKKYNLFIYAILGLFSLGTLVVIIFFLKKRKSKSVKYNKALYKNDLKRSLGALRVLYNEKQTDEFCEKSQVLLQDIVKFFSKDSNLDTAEKAYILLKEQKSVEYADLWQQTHQNLQMLRYAGVNKENLNQILANCEKLVMQIKK